MTLLFPVFCRTQDVHKIFFKDNRRAIFILTVRSLARALLIGTNHISALRNSAVGLTLPVKDRYGSEGEIYANCETIILFFNQIPDFKLEFSVKPRQSIKNSTMNFRRGNLFRVENINDVDENNPPRGIRD